MYSMKPIYQNSDKIEVPTQMYKMASLHDEKHQASNNETLNPRMKQLEDRQLSILQKLANLENEVKQISCRLGHNYGDPAPVKTIASTAAPSSEPIKLPDGTLDFVISVSANSPDSALSPYIIGEVLKRRGVDVAFPVHVHSSCKNVNSIKSTQHKCLSTGRLKTSTKAKVHFTFIFKEDPFTPNVMFSPISQTKIIGDVNIARYLCRFLVPDLYDEKDVNSVSNIDQWVDIARRMSQGSSKEKDGCMKTLNAYFGKKHTYLCSGRLSLADVSIFSSILGNTSSFKSLPKNVKPWFESMASTVGHNFNVPSNWLSE